MIELPPISLYIHIPWCVRKCPYCDFNSHVAQEIPETEYLSQLIRDLNEELCYVQGRQIESIFIGGGTPSLMSGDFYARLLQQISSSIDFSSSIEITLEANPGTLETGRFKAYRDAGINRVSLGVQSFNDAHLKALGRIHTAQEAMNAVNELEKASIDNFNIDLMHGLPHQNADEALSDINTALKLGPKHLSWYQLTIEQNTEFYRYPPDIPNDEALWDIQEKGSVLLAEMGFEQYEVSAYSKKGYQSRHNRNYWTYGDYLGIGAGAHAKITNIDGEIFRYRKTRLPADYLKCIGAFKRGEELISQEDLPFEFMMNALRLTDGVPEHFYTDRTGLTLDTLEPALTLLRNQGLLKKQGLATTKQGLLFLNEILEKFT